MNNVGPVMYSQIVFKCMKGVTKYQRLLRYRSIKLYSITHDDGNGNGDNVGVCSPLDGRCIQAYAHAAATTTSFYCIENKRIDCERNLL